MLSNSSVDVFQTSAASDNRSLLIGVDIGGTKTAVSASAGLPEILWREEFPTKPEEGPDAALRRLRKLIERALQQVGGTAQAIGISCGGPLDSVRGIIQSPPNLPTWIDVPISSILSAEFSLPCALENDANAGALAEHRYGAGRGSQHMVFLTLGTGLGAGLVLNGKLYRGATSMAGEIGHVRLTEVGPWGHGKDGSVEGWASGGGMARYGASLVRKAIAAGRSSLLAANMDQLTARDIGVALEAGDLIAAEIVEASGARLGEALAILVDLLNPECIVVGGLALRFGERLLRPARDSMRREALSAAADACSVVPAVLGERIGDFAALCVAGTAFSQG